MTEEDKKDLLLRDLCGRLPYGVYVQVVDRRHNIQSPSDRAREIYNTVDSEIKRIKRNEMTNEKRLAKIEELKKQIEKLENEMEPEDINTNYETMHEKDEIDQAFTDMMLKEGEIPFTHQN